jgi:hypothetical protein
LGELPEAERRLLELVAVCGRPTEREIVLDAAGLGSGGRPLVQRLESLGFLRTTPIGDGSGIEAYHDQIREAVASALHPEGRSQRHLEIAHSFEARGDAEPELLAHHFHGGGDLPRAARHAVVAADRAEQTLAFLRAAELYRSAREWDPPGGQAERGLLAREADALAKAGHLVEGGRIFLEAADRAPRLEALELRRRAAEHLVSGGQLDQGLGTLRDLLADLGLRYPRSPEGAIAAIACRVALLIVRGIESRANGRALDELERIRIDTCYGAGKNLVDVDVPRGIYFSVQSLMRALRRGDPERLARSLCVVGGSLSAVGGPLGRLGERMMRHSETIAEELDLPELWGTIDVARGQVLMLEGRGREAVERCDEGVRRLSEECQGYALECNVGRAMALRALEDLGRMGELEVRALELIDAAAAEGNRFAETQGSNCLAIARIARGDTDGARDLARHGRELWSRAEFDMLRLYMVRIQALCDLYEGDPRAGWERVRQIEPALQRSGLLRIPLTRIDVLSLRAQLALASAERDQGDRSGWLRECERSLRRLEREGRPDARLHAQLLRAGAANLVGNSAGALSALAEAVEIGTRSDMVLRAACARFRASELRSDVETLDRARDEMRRCGVENPDRWVGAYAPGFGGSDA